MRVSVAEAVASGDRRQALEALRAVLAAAVDEADVRTLPALAKQLGDVLRELEQLPVAKESSPVDDLNARRAARRSKAAG